MENKRPSILEGNYMYLLVTLLFITIGAFFQNREIYSGIFITEYILIALPVVILTIIRKYKFKEIFKLNKIKFKEVILTIFIVIASYPIALFLNYTMIIIISIFGEPIQPPLPVPQDNMEFIKAFFLFAITPGICEEFMFRGFIQSAYERIGAKKAVVITGLLFAMLHLNIQGFLGFTFLGILFGYMVYKTNSIYTGIIAHITNNGIALILLKIADNSKIEANTSFGAEQAHMMLAGLILLLILAIVSAIIVYFLLKALFKASKTRIGTDKSIDLPIQRVGLVQRTLEIVPIIISLLIFIHFTIKFFQYIMN